MSWELPAIPYTYTVRLAAGGWGLGVGAGGVALWPAEEAGKGGVDLPDQLHLYLVRDES